MRRPDGEMGFERIAACRLRCQLLRSFDGLGGARWPEEGSIRHPSESEGGGGRGIRTPGTVSGSVVFKTTAIDHSAIPPHAHFIRESDGPQPSALPALEISRKSGQAIPTAAATAVR